MAFPTKDSFTFNHGEQSDYPNWTPAQAKDNLNARSEEMRLALNVVANLLNATTSDASGADNVGIPETVAGSGTNVRDRADWLYAQILGVVLGAILDGSLTDAKLSNATGQIKERVATHLADYATFKESKGLANGLASLGADAKLSTSQLPAMNYISTAISRGLATKVASFPARTGSTPTYTYTIVTITIPISSTVEEMEIKLGSGHIKLFRGLNYGLAFGYSEATKPAITPVNKGYGETVVAASAAAPITLMAVLALFGSASVVLVDAYISGSTLIIKAINAGPTVLSNLSNDFEYVARG